MDTVDELREQKGNMYAIICKEPVGVFCMMQRAQTSACDNLEGGRFKEGTYVHRWLIMLM